MTIDEMRSLVGHCDFEDYSFGVIQDDRGSIYLRAAYREPDVHTGEDAVQKTRRWLLSPAMTKSEIVQTAFKCIVTSMEHRAREHFLYKGLAIFGPHFDVDALFDLASEGALDRREAIQEE